MWLWILTGLNFIMNIDGYSGGAVPAVCGSMEPKHGSFKPKETTPPFNIYYQGGNGAFTVSLQGNDSNAFVGFMLAALDDGGHHVGHFTPIDSEVTQLLNCGGLAASAVSHKNNQEKRSFRVHWIAPETRLSKDITFRATVVQKFGTFWVNVNSSLKATATTTIPTTTEPITETSTIPTTTEPITETSTIPTNTEPITETSTIPTNTEPITETSTIPTNTEPITETSTILTTFKPIAGTTWQQADRTIPEPCYTIKCKKPVTVLMVINSLLVVMKMEMSNIITTTVSNSILSRRLNRMSNIIFCMLCEAVEISSMVLLIMCESLHVNLVALLSVVIVMNVLLTVLATLPIGPSHELKEMSIPAVLVCSVILQTFTIAFIYDGYSEIEEVLYTYTVWIFLSVIWVLVFTTWRSVILQGRKIGSLKNRTQHRQQKKETLHKVFVTAASGIFIVIASALAIASIVWILWH
ncbi:uncharacterized protein LOC132960320 isoform X2 [Labrus mixtus]|uniref:uncharacterized protein LOC132960320 isoform X2 n=1 Tax=Labrus mixtus TaxID=508554 RepID=UPI0029C0B75F|nr:uncharacterized protein LOC132960320 isoform X2 [Labrus mixtus]